MEIFDSHAHLDGPEYDEDREEVLARAQQAGVCGIVCIGSGADLTTAERTVALCHDRPGMWPTVGIHPHDVARIDPTWWPALERLAALDEVVGVGETGLDYYYDHSPPEQQMVAFLRFLELGTALDKAVVCHIRDAHADAIAALRRLRERGKDTRIVIHCFTGTVSDAKAYLELGCVISFSGIVTFGKSAAAIRDAARLVPADRLLVETDCPYLAPKPHRGRRNEPAFVVDTLNFIASLRGEPAADLARDQAATCRRVFALT